MKHEKFYSKYIEKLYGTKDIHDEYYNENYNEDDPIDDPNPNHENISNKYNINDNERIDLTHLEVYSIDPEGCEDVDDAFSYYEKDDFKYIVIHIADPTQYINHKSELLKILC